MKQKIVFKLLWLQIMSERQFIFPPLQERICSKLYSSTILNFFTTSFTEEFKLIYLVIFIGIP